jgi:hypothetical protein
MVLDTFIPDFSIRALRIVIRISESMLKKGLQGACLNEKDAIVAAVTSYIIPKLTQDDIGIIINHSRYF